MDNGHRGGERFMPMVQLGAQPGDCWRWLGTISKSTGYGKKQWHGRSLLAHRWIYEQLFGRLPDGAVIDHKCRNRWCVNPHHLEAVHQAENVRRGIGTKLTAPQVEEIRAAIPTLKWGQRKVIAAKYGVSPQLISDIKYGRAWI